MEQDQAWQRKQDIKLACIKVPAIVAEVVGYAADRRSADLLKEAEAVFGARRLREFCKEIVEWWTHAELSGYRYPLTASPELKQFVNVVSEFRELVDMNGAYYLRGTREEVFRVLHYCNVATLAPPTIRYVTLLECYNTGVLTEYETSNCLWDLLQETEDDDYYFHALCVATPPALLRALRASEFPHDESGWQQYMSEERFFLSNVRSYIYSLEDKQRHRAVIEKVREFSRRSLNE